MSHRVIIRDAIVALVNSSEVQDQLTPNQRARVASICGGPQPPCDDDMRYLLRCIDRAYAQDD